MEQINEYTLTADEQAMINPLIETVDNLQRDAQAILRAITRLRGLEGTWNLNGNRLVRADPKPPALPAPRPSEQQIVEVTSNGNG